MALETATYISQLVDTNPTAGDPVSQGDDHLRLIKDVLQNQFPGLGAAAVTVTAAQLNGVTGKLTSFNGRATPAAVPTEGDYTLDLLGDVAIAAPALGQYLRYNGASWANLAQGLVCGDFLYDGYAGRVTSSVWFSNQRRLNVADGGATIKNNGSSGIGWQLEATAPIMLTLSLMSNNIAAGTSTGFSIAIGRFQSPASPTAAMPGAGINRHAFSNYAIPETTDEIVLTATASFQIATGDKVCLYFENSGTATPDSFTLSGSFILL